MSVEKSRTRICDGCGKKIEYLEKNCFAYLNRFNKECLTAPKDDFLVLSVPSEEKRKFFDFCSCKCLISYVKKELK